jgi:hypothetical protein
MIQDNMGFISHRLLEPPGFHRPHSAIHDMDSLFSVLLYICLTRAGRGGQRQGSNAEQRPSAEEKERLNRIHVMRYLFFDCDTDTLLANKRTLFANGEDDIKTYLFPSFDPYFEPIQELILDWFRVLKAAFHNDSQHQASVLYLFPIEAFKAALAKAINKVSALPMTEEHANRRDAVAKWREDYLAEIRSMSSNVPSVCGTAAGLSLDASPLCDVVASEMFAENSLKGERYDRGERLDNPMLYMSPART